MGQKINPTGFRLAINKNWSSKWYSNSKNFPILLNNDIKVRAFLNKKLAAAAVSKIVIERPAKNAKITIFTARPGIVIGKKGEDIETLRSSLEVLMGIPTRSPQRARVVQSSTSRTTLILLSHYTRSVPGTSSQVC